MFDEFVPHNLADAVLVIGKYAQDLELVEAIGEALGLDDGLHGLGQLSVVEKVEGALSYFTIIDLRHVDTSPQRLRLNLGVFSINRSYMNLIQVMLKSHALFRSIIVKDKLGPLGSHMVRQITAFLTQ